MLTLADKGGWGFLEMLIMADKGVGRVWTPPFLADIQDIRVILQKNNDWTKGLLKCGVRFVKSSCFCPWITWKNVLIKTTKNSKL